MKNKNIIFFCKVCGFKNSNPPWGYDGKTPLFEFCPCCGVEFGYQDASSKGIELYRNSWIKNGCIWLNEKLKPTNWNISKQLEYILNELKK